jgi:hypothetical protein
MGRKYLHDPAHYKIVISRDTGMSGDKELPRYTVSKRHWSKEEEARIIETSPIRDLFVITSKHRTSYQINIDVLDVISDRQALDEIMYGLAKQYAQDFLAEKDGMHWGIPADNIEDKVGEVQRSLF